MSCIARPVPRPEIIRVARSVTFMHALQVLDEPTNHLDLETIAALSNALRNFQARMAGVRVELGRGSRGGSEGECPSRPRKTATGHVRTGRIGVCKSRPAFHTRSLQGV